MDPETREGAGSYLAVGVMVYLGVHGAPVWMILLSGLGYGTFFALILGWLMHIGKTIYQVGSIASVLIYGRLYGTPEKQAELLTAYTAYIYDYTKQMSDLQKRTD